MQVYDVLYCMFKYFGVSIIKVSHIHELFKSIAYTRTVQQGDAFG